MAKEAAALEGKNLTLLILSQKAVKKRGGTCAGNIPG